MSKRALSLSVQNFKGGVGKTTISINIAHILSLAGYNVLLIDMDEQGSSTDVLDATDGSSEEDGTIHFLTVAEIIGMDLFSLYTRDVDVNRYICKTRYQNLDIIPNARNVNSKNTFDVLFDRYEIPEKQKYAAFYNNIEKLRADYDYIIIDSQPHAGSMANLSIIVSDFVITPIDADRYNLNTMLDVYQRVMALNKQFGLNVEYLGFFLNKCVLSGDIDKQLMDYYKQNFPELYIDHPIRLSRDVSQKSGYSRSMFLEYSKRAGAGLDLLALVVNDLGMIDKTHQKKLVENGISKKMMKPKNKLGDNKF